MTSDIKNEDPKSPDKKIFAEALGRYSLIDATKVYQFSFPANVSLTENYAALTYMRDQVWATLEQQKKDDDKAKVEKTSVKPDKIEKCNVPIETVLKKPNG